MPRLHAILASKSKRIGELEHHLRETRETASQEYEMLRAENDKLQQSFMARLKEKERESECASLLACPVERGGSGNEPERNGNELWLGSLHWCLIKDFRERVGVLVSLLALWKGGRGSGNEPERNGNEAVAGCSLETCIGASSKVSMVSGYHWYVYLEQDPDGSMETNTFSLIKQLYSLQPQDKQFININLSSCDIM